MSASPQPGCGRQQKATEIRWLFRFFVPARQDRRENTYCGSPFSKNMTLISSPGLPSGWNHRWKTGAISPLR